MPVGRRDLSLVVVNEQAPRRTSINLMDAIMPGLCAGCEARHIGLCAALDDEDLHFLASVARSQSFSRSETFIVEGDDARYFYNINHGTCKLYKDLADGRRQITGFVGVGDFVGLAAHDHYVFTAEALEDVKLCRFDRRELRAVFSRFPALERQLLAIASHELVVAQDQMLLLGRKTAIERIASFLVAWSHREGCVASASGALDLPMSRADLADYLGLTIETVSRALTSLKRQNLIDIGAHHAISIIDAGRLGHLSNADI
ncbi:MAG: Crp/Fnr family transcriptional regulator [Rhodospirillales bacterium 20-60-12]|nr:MAG: Crp/Fnr family transcriptional regulator [Rhodospirillales bacterium 20-60-12]